jgi:hypothetical protein
MDKHPRKGNGVNPGQFGTKPSLPQGDHVDFVEGEEEVGLLPFDIDSNYFYRTIADTVLSAINNRSQGEVGQDFGNGCHIYVNVDPKRDRMVIYGERREAHLNAVAKSSEIKVDNLEPYDALDPMRRIVAELYPKEFEKYETDWQEFEAKQQDEEDSRFR